MSAFKFLHAADLHLDSPLRGLARRGEAADAFVGASRRALENLVSAAIEEQVAFLVVAGDIYDGDWRDYATGQFFVRQMGRLARAGVRVFLLRGNHDAESVITRSLPLPQNVHNFSVRSVDTVRLDDIGVALHGRGFGQRHIDQNVAQAYPPALAGLFNIGVLHTSLTGREGHDVYAPCAVDDLRRLGYDYWALGHVHRREIVCDAPCIVYPGNLQGRHARETGPKGATLVRVIDGRIAALEALTLDAARFDHRRIDLGGVDSRAMLADAARREIAAACAEADGRPLALRLTFCGETDLAAWLAANAEQVREDMQAFAAEAGADTLIEKVRNETTTGRAQSVAELTGFDEILAEVAADPEFLAAVRDDLAKAQAKAPPAALRLLQPEGDDAATAAVGEAQRRLRAALDLGQNAEPSA